MLYVYFGNDVTRVRQKAFDFLHTLVEEDTLVTQLTSEMYQEGIINDLAQGSSLFRVAHVVLIDTPSEDTPVLEDLEKYGKVMSQSLSHFIVIENVLTAPHKKKLGEYAEHFEEITGNKKKRFNAFLLTDAFLRRDKKSLWLLLTEAWREGLTNEEIVGVLFWQIKILRLVEKTKSAEESGQKPFVYSKAKRALAHFKKGELDVLSQRFLTLYHDGHRGVQDMSIALERLVLTL